MSPNSVGTGFVILAEPRCPGAAAAALYSGAVCRGEHLFTVAVSPKEPLQSTLAKVSNFIGISQGRCRGMEKEKTKKKGLGIWNGAACIC